MSTNVWKYSPAPKKEGVHVLVGEPLENLVPWIDWKYFLMAWGVQKDKEQSEQLLKEGRTFLDKIISERLLEARAVIGFYRVRRIGDSLDLYETNEMLHFLRQQVEQDKDAPLRSLADYFSPYDSDWIGLFALSVGFGVEAFQKESASKEDIYSGMLLHTLSARLTEAYAEKLHRDVMKDYWGYAPNEPFGIRPAPGYPACPDHTEKRTFWRLLHPDERVGIQLTESDMMLPDCSICGYYMAHPQSRYFSVGPIGEDQQKEYEERKMKMKKR